MSCSLRGHIFHDVLYSLRYQFRIFILVWSKKAVNKDSMWYVVLLAEFDNIEVFCPRGDDAKHTILLSC